MCVYVTHVIFDMINFIYNNVNYILFSYVYHTYLKYIYTFIFIIYSTWFHPLLALFLMLNSFTNKERNRKN